MVTINLQCSAPGLPSEGSQLRIQISQGLSIETLGADPLPDWSESSCSISCASCAPEDDFWISAVATDSSATTQTPPTATDSVTISEVIQDSQEPAPVEQGLGPESDSAVQASQEIEEMPTGDPTGEAVPHVNTDEVLTH